MITTRLMVAGALAVVWMSPAAAQFTARVPAELTEACSLDRTTLSATTVARNAEVYPDKATRVAGGWLVFDRYDKQVIEIDDDLREVARWGRPGPGPLEYEQPIGLARTAAGHVVVIDRAPPSVLVFARERNEYQIRAEVIPGHAVVTGDQLLLAGTDGSVHVAPLADPSAAERLWTSQDFGITRTEKGALPVMLLRPAGERGTYFGFKGPSTVWHVPPGGRPRQVLQRCVHERLRAVHEEAPRIEIPGFGTAPYTVETLQDFVVLESGRILALGGLRVGGDTAARSIELYDTDGRLVRAWRLNRSEALGIFDPETPSRMLIWDEKDVEGIQLIELSGAGYMFRGR